MQNESVALFYRNGSSDKVYQAQLEKDDRVFGPLWRVNFQYGGRGKALKAGTKTKEPVSYEKAKKAFDALVRSKKAKGYTEDGSGVAYTNSDVEVTDYLPQLLNEVTELEILSLFDKGHELWMQIKHDGERRGILCTNDNAIGANRKGLAVAMRTDIQEASIALARRCGGKLVLDTEDMGDNLMVFDPLYYELDLRPFPFSQRVRPLVKIAHHIYTSQLDKFLQVDLPCKAKSKRHIQDVVTRAKQNNEEGVVFRMNVPYTPGRPNSGGPCLKLKFWKSATCRVASVHDTKASIGLEVWCKDTWVPVGNCTVSAKHNMPKEGNLVEIKYLYAYKGGSLFEPSYKGTRPDLDVDAADISQLKYKK